MSSTKRGPRLEVLLLFIIIILLIVILGIICKCPCRKCPPVNKADTISWGSWNILFKKTTTANIREEVTERLKDTLANYLVNDGLDTSQVHISFHAYFCPCDSFLVNVDVKLINESGNPVTPPTPVKPVPSTGGLGGDVFAALANKGLFIPEFDSATHVPTHNNPSDTNFIRYPSPPPQRDEDPVLAVIDTGLDSLQFIGRPRSELSALVWKDLSGAPTLYNFLIGADPGQLTDDEIEFKHGTSVTYVALKGYGGAAPRIMVLKALDGSGKGSSFTVSCAMSYALQHKAGVINASLGYQGPEDPIMKHYFSMADSLKIPVIVAAGNDPSHPHHSNLICTDDINHADSLTDSNVFYPAGFGLQMNYVISVTGVNTDTLPCYYQNFSPRQVYVGVMNTGAGLGAPDTCCAYLIPYLKDAGGNTQYVEGSSFATPFVSGFLLSVGGSHPVDPRSILDRVVLKSEKLKPYINSGRFIKN